MELTNKRTLYTVSNEDTNLKLIGEVTHSNNAVTSFSGSLLTLEGLPSGNFNYSEQNGNVNINVNNCPQAQIDNAYAIIDNTVSEIKTKLTV